MRLLNTSTYELHDSAGQQYAILSHRWQPPEISFQMLNPAELRDSRRRSPQLDKLRNACAKAREDKLDWLWSDTCCIDKSNAVEETRSINSMFEWYYRAKVCYAYVLDVRFDGRASAPSQQMFASQKEERRGQKSEWFERGWTLQELLAPQNIKFYDQNWNYMGTKSELAGILEAVTRIDRRYLTHELSFKKASVAMRMSWMAGMTTTQVEDIAYSLLGILSVSMPTQYGEGVQAFLRLQKTLLESSSDESIFAWTMPTNGLTCYRGLGRIPQWNPDPPRWGLLAPSPDCFSKYNDLIYMEGQGVPRLSGGYRWTQQGVQFQMPYKSNTEMTNWAGLARKEITLTLNCWRKDAGGNLVTIQIQLLKRGDVYDRVKFDDLVQKKGAKVKTNSVMGIDQGLTRPLTVVQPPFDPLG